MSDANVNWSEHQDAFLWGRSGGDTGPDYGDCCGCCCAYMPAQVKLSISNLGLCDPEGDPDDPLDGANGTWTLDWLGYEDVYAACVYGYDIEINGYFYTFRFEFGNTDGLPCADPESCWAASVQYNDGGGVLAMRAWVKGDGPYQAPEDWAGAYATLYLSEGCTDGGDGSASVGAV
jgi:hypothetical protein